MSTAVEVHLNSFTTILIPLIILSINFFLYCPITTYFAIKFWKLRNELFFKKRHPYFILSIVMGIQIWLCISPTLTLTIILANSDSDELKHINNFIRNMILCFLAMVLVRFWRLYFDYSHALQLKGIKWQKNIVQHLSLHPWTLKYKYLSSTKFLTTIIVISTVIFETILELRTYILF